MDTIPESVLGVSPMFVLIIMSGMVWGGALSHVRHADKVKKK